MAKTKAPAKKAPAKPSAKQADAVIVIATKEEPARYVCAQLDPPFYYLHANVDLAVQFEDIDTAREAFGNINAGKDVFEIVEID